jgi:Zn-dependent peptidase ImmA (M78 family)
MTLARKHKLKVVRDRHMDYRGVYISAKRQIRLGEHKHYSKTDRILTLAHELGHHLDYVTNTEAYVAGCFHQDQYYYRERVAWDNARKLLEQCGFWRWKIYSKSRKNSLSVYKYYLDRNRLFEFVDKLE